MSTNQETGRRTSYVIEGGEDGRFAILRNYTCTRHRARCGCDLYPDVIAHGLTAGDVLDLIASAVTDMREMTYIP